MSEFANQSSLRGTTVMVTRPLQQAKHFAEQLSNLGAEPILFPCIEIVTLDCTPALTALGIELAQVDIFIFISSNAVQHAFTQITQLCHPTVRAKTFAAIGQTTAQALQNLGVTQVLVPDQGYDSESLLVLPALQNIQGQNVLIFKGVGGRTELYDTLSARGACVRTIDVYRRQLPQNVNLANLEPAPSAILFSSSESVENMLKIIPAHKQGHVLSSQTITGHERIAAKVTSLGFEKLPIIAANPSDPAMLHALIGWANRTENHNDH